MKFLKTLALAAIAFVSVSAAKAQDLTDNYSRIYAGYSMMKFPKATGAIIDEAFNGFAVGYSYGFNITGHNAPVFLEVGAEYNFLSCTKDPYDAKFHAINVPIDFSYKFGNEDFAVAPYIGQTLRFGLSFENGKYDLFEDDLERWVMGYSHFSVYGNVGVNFTIKSHYSIGYRFMFCESSMVPEMSKGNVTTQESAKDNNHFITIGYTF